MLNEDWHAVEAIKMLKARYFRFLDAKAYDGLDSIFTDDAVIDLRGATKGADTGDAAVAGLDGLISGRDMKLFFRANLGSVSTAHHGHMPEITLESPLRASGVWSLEDWIWFAEGSAHRSMHGWGQYDDEYMLTEGRWQISAMRLTRLRTVFEPW